MRVALTIAGSDSSGGAGIQADLKTFMAVGVYGASVVTALTAQNTLTMSRVMEVPDDVVAAQLEAVLSDLDVQAIKTGMLCSAAVVRAVAAKLAEHGAGKLVVDPVMVAKTGDSLLSDEAIAELRDRLLPLALVVTPNIPEAEVLVGGELAGRDELRQAARRIHAMGARHVVIKGGHAGGDESVDIVFDGTSFVELTAPRIASPHTHGTGCTFSAAIAGYLAQGRDVADAVALAKEFVFNAISHAAPLGHGRGPLNHMWRP